MGSLSAFIGKMTTYYWGLRYKICNLPQWDIMSNEEAVDLIKNQGFSLSRFGDGEFRWMNSNEDECNFQKPSPELKQKLTEAFAVRSSNLLLGIPALMQDNAACVPYARNFWRRYSVINRQWLRDTISEDRRYVDTNITRPYIDYLDKEKAFQQIELVKSIWDQRNVLIVEGEKTKFGVGNNLLSNTNQVKRIIAPAENAFSCYSEIKDRIQEHATRDTLILACLGPTASALAVDLCLDGYQIIDIGHFDIEYEWYLMGAQKKVPIPGKYVNEAGYFGDNTLNDDVLYRSSIVSVIEE